MVRNSDAAAVAVADVAAGGGGDHCNAVVVAADVDISCFQESNEMAAAAYDSFGTDQTLQEDNAIPAAVAWTLDEQDCSRAGVVDPDDGVAAAAAAAADRRNSEDTSSGGQFECMAADHLPWKDALLSGHQNLGSYLLRMKNKSITGNSFGLTNGNGNSAFNRIECNALFVGMLDAG